MYLELITHLLYQLDTTEEDHLNGGFKNVRRFTVNAVVTFRDCVREIPLIHLENVSWDRPDLYRSIHEFYYASFHYSLLQIYDFKKRRYDVKERLDLVFDDATFQIKQMFYPNEIKIQKSSILSRALGKNVTLNPVVLVENSLSSTNRSENDDVFLYRSTEI